MTLGITLQGGNGGTPDPAGLKEPPFTGIAAIAKRLEEKYVSFAISLALTIAWSVSRLSRHINECACAE